MIKRLSEYDRRQLALMLDFIHEFETGRIGLGQLVSNLEALKSALESPPSTFSQTFEPLWGQLEITYAMMLDEERTDPSDLDKGLIDESVSGLRTLIAQMQPDP